MHGTGNGRIRNGRQKAGHRRIVRPLPLVPSFLSPEQIESALNGLGIEAEAVSVPLSSVVGKATLLDFHVAFHP
jgi:hypothetical protein